MVIKEKKRNTCFPHSRKRALSISGFIGTLSVCACLTACGVGPAELQQGTGSLTQEARSFHRPGLGIGVDFAETKTYGQCVTTPASETRHGIASGLYDEVAIRDRNELNSVLGVDASVTAKGLWGSAGGSASYFKSVSMSSDAFYWLVYADYKLRDNGIDLSKVELTDAAKEILRGPRGLEGFYEACGEYFYSASQQGAMYALLYEFKSAEEKTIEKIKAAASYEGFGVQAKASFEKFAQLAVKSSILKVHAATSGASERLRSYATNPEQLEEELRTLRDDLYNHGTGVETQWYVSDYNMFPDVQAAKAVAMAANKPAEPSLPKLVKEFALTNLYQQHVRNVDLYQRVIAHLGKASGSEPLFGYGPEKRMRMNALLKNVDKQSVALAERAKGCLMGTDAKACAIDDLIPAAWDADDIEGLLQPDQDYTTLLGWLLFLAQRPGSAIALDFVGHDANGTRTITFATGYTVINSALGVLGRANEDPGAVTVMGTADLVRDPDRGQMRPNVCVYGFDDVCNLRIVPLAGRDQSGNTVVKLQAVFFDTYGFVQKKLDFPALD